MAHLKRKFICAPLRSDDDLSEEYKKYNISRHPVESIPDDNLKQCILKLVDTFNRQIEQKDKELRQKDEEIRMRDKQFEAMNRQINDLIQKAGSNITQNAQTIHNVNNILAFKDTDVSHLTDQDFVRILKQANFCVPKMIEKIHFDPTKPENHNIFISNLKNNYVLIYNGEKWMITDRDNSIQNLIDRNECILEQKIEEWVETGNKYPEIMNKFNRYLEKREDNNILDKIKDEIKLLLYNHRDLCHTQRVTS